MLLDANLLIYAKISDYPQHEKTRTWLEENSTAPLASGFPGPACSLSRASSPTSGYSIGR